MPISKKVIFMCSKCKYKETRIVGDVLPSKSMLEPCPKCGGFMQMTQESETSFTVDDILNVMKKIIPKKH